jgi:uncharacterized membrane protein
MHLLSIAVGLGFVILSATGILFVMQILEDFRGA